MLPLVASVLLAACGSSPQRAPRGVLRFVDTETAGRLRHTAAVGRAASAAAPAATRVVASVLAQAVPVLLTLLEGDNAVGELEERLVECARKAERQVNAAYFGNRSPTRQECGEEVEVDRCGERITRAMVLGQRKHEVALRCAREVLEERWRRPYSIEQRYRYYPHAKVVERVSREEESRLLKEGCTKELWRTIKPDLVLHENSGLLLKSVLTVDYKFPCPDTNKPQWKEYGGNSAYAGSDQGRIYRDALGGKTFLISPRMGVSQ
ncbi:hypothetical protein [Myxococcus sp. RHSTA-1-4]|uniref:hypothetical protein n=1 Tax=Myxococcus sp. RHSTA-1-4 TaxID=2874601 RepID=UPI001CBCF15F|nr:hypothetical protein [Myxococcus sp. RHSTA-1-4]